MSRLKFAGYSVGVLVFIISAILFVFGGESETAVNEPAQMEPVRVPSNNPVQDSFELFVGGIYRTGVDVAKVPFELVKNFVIRAKLGDYIDDLPLDEKVKKRVKARIDRKDFVDEVVPFLLTLKDQYVAPEGTDFLKYENYVRKNFGSGQAIPGFEHSLFHFTPEQKEKSTTDFKLDNKIVARLVEMYDLLFIQSDISPLKGDLNITPELIAKIKPMIEGLLRYFQSQMDPKSEIAEGIEGILSTPERVETITISLIQAVNWMAKKNFTMFAQRAFRSSDLKKWFLQELDKPKGGRLFQYMKYALNERRYSMQVVVDGLQGQLMESLSLQKPNDPFFARLAEDTTKENFKKPQAREVKEPQAQQWDFLKSLQTQNCKDQRYLPYFRSLFTEHINGMAMQGVSTTPTISVRNLPIAKTGSDVVGADGGTGIPNFHFVDRAQNRAYYFFGNDALQLEKLAQTAGMRTMFDRLRGFSTLNCNAQYDNLAHKSYDGFLNLGLGERVRDFGDRLCYLDLQQRSKNEKELRQMRKKILEYENDFKKSSDVSLWISKKRMRTILKEIAELEDQGLPQYVLYYNPWPDHFAHFKGPFSDEIIGPTGELNRLDYWLGQMSQIYKNAGVWDRTMMAMAGDHGLTPVFYLINPETEIFTAMNERGIPLVVEKISSDEGEGPKMNNPLRPPSMRGKDVVVASTAGGNYMLDFFTTQGAGWEVQPVYSDLLSLRLLSGHTVNMIDEILQPLKDTLDYLVVREKPSQFSAASVRVMGYRNGKLQTTVLHRRGTKIFLQGSFSLLGLDQFSKYEPQLQAETYRSLFRKCITAASKSNSATWCNEDDWREFSRHTEKPDVVVQLSHIYDSDRAGTINLFPRQGIGYNSKVPGRHAGEHFHEKDAFVGFWGGSLQIDKRLQNCVNGSLSPQIYEFLTGRRPIVGVDGWGFSGCF